MAFANYPKLRLHDLTYKDIKRYVHDTLSQHPSMMELSQQNKHATQTVVQEIVTSASGVFLWVSIVVDLLLEGLQNYDTISDLHQRLLELPPDLEELFEHMLRNINPRYKVQSSKLFQIVRLYKEQPARIDTDMSTSPLTPLMLSHAKIIASYKGTTSCPSDNPAETLREDQVPTVVRTWSAGLIEVRPHRANLTSIDYLHRSVFDFVRQHSVWTRLIASTEGTGFDARASLITVSNRLLEEAFPDISDSTKPSQPQDVQYYQRELLQWSCNLASSPDTRLSQALVHSLDDLDRTLEASFERYRVDFLAKHSITLDNNPSDVHWSELFRRKLSMISSDGFHTSDSSKDIRGSGSHSYSFLCFAIQTGLIEYVQSKLAQHEIIFYERSRRPLLDFACEEHDLSRSSTIKAARVGLILQHGGDPNGAYGGFTPWQTALYTLLDHGRKSDPSLWFDALECLILHGANPHAFIGRSSTAHDSKGGYDWMYSALFVIRRMVRNAPNWRSTQDYHDCWMFSKGSPRPSNRWKGERLVSLLEERNAKAEAWHRVNVQGKYFWVLYNASRLQSKRFAWPTKTLLS